MRHRFSSLNDNLIVRRVWSLDGHDSTRTAPPTRRFASPFAVSTILRWVQNAVIEDILFARGA
jgi:hypothetical protein